ncbi:hypothetical protein Lalb_Chr11g0068551 [Lupinus albus]|uniref:Uncharacterized protein n=1 Tax=Lupinus albus TaxID=3870 RepID=A0A6A4PRD7_LUPAL|nr:hypothetical protein Lalb_Chr11g0068551 [Lupinus albus]
MKGDSDGGRRLLPPARGGIKRQIFSIITHEMVIISHKIFYFFICYPNGSTK